MPLSHGSWVAEAGTTAREAETTRAREAETTRPLARIARTGARMARPQAGLALLTEVPRLPPGVQQLGEFQDSGLTGATYLVRNATGQVVQVSRLLNQVLTGIDGRSTISEIAVRVSTASGRPVSAGNVEYLLANKLAPLNLLTAAGAGVQHHGAHNHGVHNHGPQEQAGSVPAASAAPVVMLGLRLRRTLVPEAGVQHIARLLQPLFMPGVVMAAVIALAGTDTWMFRVGRLGPAADIVLLHPPLLLVVIGLSVLSMLFHECGHAAACRYGGARPGVIGVGFYVIWPAFFTNVTDTYRLSRAARIRTDLGGVYFNVVFVLALMATYSCTGYVPLLPAVFLIHLEIIQQLLPSLRLDGYFILADMIGVPDLFRRIGPTLRAMIPGRPADPRVRGLRRGPRVILTVWVLLVVPLLGFELALVVIGGPGLLRTFAHSLNAQGADLTAQFGRGDVAGALVSAFSALMLILPMAGLCYILQMTGRRTARSLIAVNRRHPVLRVPSVVVVLALAAGLVSHWGLLPIGGHGTAPRPSAAAQAAGPRQASHQVSPRRPRPPGRPALPATALTPVSALGFDPLGAGASSGENNDLAGYAIDNDPQTAWQSQHYLDNPVFGGLKTGSGLILDMGQTVRLSSVTVTFGSNPGADVAIEVGNTDTPAAATLPAFRTVAAADDIGGTHVFRAAGPAAGRYVLIWFTKLPPAGPNQFAAQIYNIGIRGTATADQAAT